MNIISFFFCINFMKRHRNDKLLIKYKGGIQKNIYHIKYDET